MRTHIAFAALTGLMLRIYFVLKFPVTQSGDAPFYIELAWNWLKNGVYGFPVNGQLTPVDMRVPGYPAFLAAIFAFAGKSPRAVMLAQAVLDVVGCFLIALIAERLAPAESRRRAFIAGLWLAVLCPFTANYPAVVLTETLVTFLTAIAILVLLETDLGRRAANGAAKYVANGFFTNPWVLAGIVVGFGTLVRPETPLLLISAGLVLCARWWRPQDWPKLARAGIFLGLGMLLPLVPWAASYERGGDVCRKRILRESVGIGGDRGGVRHIGAAGNTTPIDFGGTRIVREVVASAGLAKAGASGNFSWIGGAVAACAVGGEKLEGAAQSAVSCAAL